MLGDINISDEYYYRMVRFFIDYFPCDIKLDIVWTNGVPDAKLSVYVPYTNIVFYVPKFYTESFKYVERKYEEQKYGNYNLKD